MACSPQELVTAASCFSCQPVAVQIAILIHLACAIRDGETVACDPQALVNDANCILQCVPQGMTLAALIPVFCDIANGGGAGGGAASFAHFFALMPGDNADTVASNTAIDFPQDGAFLGADITRASASQFTIVTTGYYRITSQVSVDEAAQIAVAINGVKDTNTVVGRATGMNQIFLDVILALTAADVITIINGASAAALTITPIAGGTDSVSATLNIVRMTTASGGSGTSCILCGAVDPVAAPGTCTCATYYNTANGGWFYWDNPTLAWVQLIGG